MEFRAQYALEFLKAGNNKLIQDENDNAFWMENGKIYHDCWDTNNCYNVEGLTEQEFLEKYSDMLFVELAWVSF